jgi:phosphohistidine phosphatase SixA
MKRALFTLLTLAASAAAAQPVAPSTAEPAIFVVRHAERADGGSGVSPMMGSDPDLSDAGRARAESLATILKNAGITTILTTEYKRTRQTAEPIARQLALEVITVPAKDLPGLIEKARGAKGNVLIVGHSNTVPNVLKGLGVTEPVSIADAEYDNLFVVTPGSPPHLLRLHFR